MQYSCKVVDRSNEILVQQIKLAHLHLRYVDSLHIAIHLLCTRIEEQKD